MLRPAPTRRVCYRRAALGHHLHQVSHAQFDAKMLPHEEDDDPAIEVATLEQTLYAPLFAHGRPSANSAASIADRFELFVP